MKSLYSNLISAKTDTSPTNQTHGVPNATICSGETYTWAANKTNYTTAQSGLRISNNSCTADQVLNLTVTPSSDNVTTIAACDSYTWNGTTYNTTGVYTGNTTNYIT